ncbi:unnamed protein product [Effrenium voratum]|uniref:Uncharacterized protein n=1 Tax=Effrenium voratum TaxID=2562239 RepID=A0AA36HWK9_9DINO|nr:unnamed protein product [Effrenium voratum]
MSALLDPNLDPRGFEEFCLSRQLVREACVSSGLEGLEGLEGPSAFRNSLLAKRSELLACGSELLRISVEDGSQCVRVGLAKGWPQSGAVTSGNCGIDVVLRRGSKLQLVGPGNSGDSKVWELELPEGAADPGELLAAAATAGSCHVLFTKSVQHEAQPAHCLTLVEVRLDDPPIYKFLFQLFGPAPLAAVVAGNGCVVLSNGPYVEGAPCPALWFEGPPEPAGPESAEADRFCLDDEADEDLQQLMAGKGMQLPQGRKKAACLTLRTEHGCVHRSLGFPAATGFPLEKSSLGVVLHLPQGHGAICHAVWQPPSEMEVRHVDTFPGLALFCQMPHFAYLALSQNCAWAVLGRWRGEVEVFQHPRGATRGNMQGLQLPESCQLRGLQLLDDVLFVWHTGGLMRYQLQTPRPTEDWGEAPVAEPTSWV